ncbi:MAG: tetratricopeptide repeat protein [Verrucomicrobiales bacterium]
MKAATLVATWAMGLVVALNSGCIHANASKREELRTSTKSAASNRKNSIPVPILSEREVEERIKTLAHYATGLSLDLNDKSDEAIEEYWKVVNTDPSNEQLVLDLARRFIRDKKPDRAIVVLQKAAKNPRASGTLYAWLGVAYAQTGKTREAIQANKTAIKRMPKNLAAYQNLGQLYIQDGKPKQALVLLKDASNQKDLDVDFLLGLCDTYLRYSRQRLITDQELIPILVPLLDRVAALNPTDPLAIQKLAETYLAAGELKKAEPFFNQLLERFPDMPGLRERLAGLYIRTGNKEKAGELFEIMRQSRPTDPQAYILLGSLAYENQNFEKAADYYVTALKLNPDFEPLYYDLAGTYLVLRKPEEGLKILEEARIRFRLNFTLEFYTGVLKSAIQKHQEALGHFTSAEVLARNSDPSKLNPQFYYQLGSAQERVGNLVEAEKAFRKALEIQPNYPDVLNHMAYMWAERGENLEEAFTMIEKALKAEPTNSAFLDSMAWVLFKQGKHAEALTWMEKAIEHSEEPDATLLEHLGDIYLALQQDEKAKEAFEKSIKLQASESVEKKLRELKIP